MTAFVIVIVAACMTWAIVAGFSAMHFCQVRGMAVNPVILGIEMLNGLSMYRRLTREATGQVGRLFYHYVVPVNIALLIVIVALIVKLV